MATFAIPNGRSWNPGHFSCSLSSSPLISHALPEITFAVRQLTELCIQVAYRGQSVDGVCEIGAGSLAQRIWLPLSLRLPRLGSLASSVVTWVAQQGYRGWTSWCLCQTGERIVPSACFLWASCLRTLETEHYCGFGICLYVCSIPSKITLFGMKLSGVNLSLIKIKCDIV